jgi:uncharacterized protein YifE (UPF0438 family)
MMDGGLKSFVSSFYQRPGQGEDKTEMVSILMSFRCPHLPITRTFNKYMTSEGKKKNLWTMSGLTSQMTNEDMSRPHHGYPILEKA